MNNANGPSALRAIQDTGSQQMKQPRPVGVLRQTPTGYWQAQLRQLVRRYSALFLQGEKMVYCATYVSESMAKTFFRQACVLVMSRDQQAWQPSLLFSPF